MVESKVVSCIVLQSAVSHRVRYVRSQDRSENRRKYLITFALIGNVRTASEPRNRRCCSVGLVERHTYSRGAELQAIYRPRACVCSGVFLNKAASYFIGLGPAYVLLCILGHSRKQYRLVVAALLREAYPSACLHNCKLYESGQQV